jgi:spore germination protein YaaH
MSCYANKDYVKNCHAMGIQVWALVDDFNSEIDRLEVLSHKDSRAKIINRLISDAQTYGYDGINIDFEKVTEQTAEHYLQFVRELSFACRSSNIILSADTYVPMSYNTHYNRKELGFWLDYIVIMGYDEHWKGDSEAGPVASIQFVENGIVNTLADVSADKVINAMPYYERVWYETKNTDGSVTVSSRDMSMEAAQSLLDSNGAKTMWDEDTCLYYGSYESNGTTVKIWLENAVTLEEKMKLYQKYNLAGVAGWRLGLENNDVWAVIESYLN